MSRAYKCVFVSDHGDVATTVGIGNTRMTAERSASRKIPKSDGRLTWTLRSIEPISTLHGGG